MKHELKDETCDLVYATELKKLGVPQESLFYWVKSKGDSWHLCLHMTYSLNYYEASSMQIVNASDEIYATFTVGELLRKIPGCTSIAHSIEYIIDNTLEYPGQERADAKLANGLAKMLIYLIKNGFVKVEDLKKEKGRLR